MAYSRYDLSYMFYYSERPGTLAQRRYVDDVPEDVKKRRLVEIVELQNRLSLESNKEDIGKTFAVLIEGDSRRDTADWKGRNSQNKMIVFPKGAHDLKKGDYVTVRIHDCTQATLLGEIV
jgi:tRNA-2-methylthio-N6-dimethylallyladenosine synthase